MPRRTPCRARPGSWLPRLYQTGSVLTANPQVASGCRSAAPSTLDPTARTTAARRSTTAMTETTDRDPTPDGDTDWLISDEPPAPGVATPPAGRRTALVAAGLVAAGALVGGVGVAALRPHSSTTAADPAGFARGQVPNGQVPNGQVPNGQTLPGQGLPGQAQGGFAGGPGGVAGEQRLGGTVTAV